MKMIQNTMTRLAALLVGILCSMAVFAQEKTDVDINLNKGGSSSNWYTQPWVWIVGAAIFVLLLVALLRGNRSGD